MATHSSVLAWRIPGTAEAGGLPSMGSQSRTRLKPLSSISSFPSGSVVKNPPDNARAVGLTPGLGRSPGKGNDNPLQYSCLGNSMDRRSLVGYSAWGHQELGMTEIQ